MSLINTFAPAEDESGFGYYRRLSADNGLAGWRELAGFAGVTRSRAGLLAHPELMASQLGLERDWADAASRQEGQSRGWKALRRTGSDAVCTACLDEDAYMRQFWDHAYVTVCPTHRLRLIDHCPGCAQRLSPHRERIELCPCGQDLRSAETQPSTPMQHWLSALIASGGSSSGGIEPRLLHVDVNAVCELVRLLCLRRDPSGTGGHKRTSGTRSVGEAIAFLAPLEQLLHDWPNAFQDHVTQRIAAGKRDARTLNTLLGPWYIRLRKICQGNSLEPFLKAVIEIAACKFDGVLGLDTAGALATEVTEHVRSADVARMLSVGHERVLTAIKNGTCAHRTRRFGTRGVVYEVPLHEVERIAEQRAEWVSEHDACKLAGVPAAVMRRMVEAGLIQADPLWRFSLFKGGPIDSISLRALGERLNVLAKPSSGSARETVLWADLTSRRMGDHRAIEAVMQAAAEGKLKAVARGRCLGQIAFQRSDVVSYFATPVLEAGMSIQQLSKETGWKWESISHWIELGLLQSQQIVLRGQPCRVIAPQQLLAFSQAYRPLADLAKAMGTRSSALVDQLGDIEIVGAKTLPSGARRGGLVRTADLVRLAVAGARVD